MSTAYLALGANLGEPEAQIRAALQAMADIAQITLGKVSSLYRSAPVGYLNQPDFINAVVMLTTALSPQQLLQTLQALETQSGRERSFRNAPRPLDLDILLYDDLVLNTETLIIPHPRMTERDFVMIPLQEISPELTIPGYGKINNYQPNTTLQRI
jgi:2-amino-4-hydroxy-6-hydroxymethyldihydropteridine diphosphokinase